MEIMINDHKSMIEFGIHLGSLIEESIVILLNGDLGAGKTTLTKGIAQGLNIDDMVTSPTFTIAKIYEDGRMILNHIDAYRLEGLGEDFGLDDYLVKDSVTVIEWSEFLPEVFHDYLDIKISYTEDGRKLELDAHGENEKKLLEVLADEVRD